MALTPQQIQEMNKVATSRPSQDKFSEMDAIAKQKPVETRGGLSGEELSNVVGIREQLQQKAGEGNIAAGVLASRYRNVDKPDTFLSKIVRGTAEVAPVVGSTIAGGIGRILGRGTGAIAAGSGEGAGRAFGESLENLAGIQQETPQAMAREAVVKPVATGTADYAIDLGLSKAGQGLKKIGSGIAGKVKGVVPKDTQRNLFKSIFTVPRKVASRMNLDQMADKITGYGIKGGLDDYAEVSQKVTGKNGVLSKAVRDALGKTKGTINTNDAISVAQNTADNALNVDDKVLKKTMKKITNMVSKRPGDLPGQGSAIDLWDTVKALEDEGYNLMNKSTDMTPRIDMEQQGQIFLNTADALKDQIDNALVNEGVIDSVKQKYAKEVANINPQLAQEFMNAKTIRDIRALAKPFVDLSNATRMTKDAGSSVFEKVLMGQQTGAQSVAINKPLTWLNPILQRPETKSFISTVGKGQPRQPGVGSSVLGKIVPMVGKSAQTGGVATGTQLLGE